VKFISWKILCEKVTMVNRGIVTQKPKISAFGEAEAG
jgi:hypothetical protein